MSKKSKNKKKPKPRNKAILSAHEMKDYISWKFEINDLPFWDWFFGETQLGETNLLSVDLDDHTYDTERNKYRKYFQVIYDEFADDADEDLNLEIENDL